MSDNTFFNMKLSKTEKEIMDFVSTFAMDYPMSKAQMVLEFVKDYAIGYLDLPIDTEEIKKSMSDEMLLAALIKKLKEKNKQKLIMMIDGCGLDFVEHEINKTKDPIFMELLEEYKKENNC